MLIHCASAIIIQAEKWLVYEQTGTVKTKDKNGEKKILCDKKKYSKKLHSVYPFTIYSNG